MFVDSGLRLLLRVERCLLLGGCKRIISKRGSIREMDSICCTEVVRFHYYCTCTHIIRGIWLLAETTTAQY